jgi:hypothetical protein
MTEQAKKVCPLIFSANQRYGSVDCIGEKCACYVSLVKPVYITKDIIDPEDCYRYEGCGLVANVPLILSKRTGKEGTAIMSTEPKIDYSKLSELELLIVVANRDIAHFAMGRWDEIINKSGEAQGFLESAKQAPKPPKTESAVVNESVFLQLCWEPQHSEKMGDYDIAAQKNCDAKFADAIKILQTSNATIKDRYHGEGYQYSYWLYGEGRIFRQKLKPRNPKGATPLHDHTKLC